MPTRRTILVRLAQVATVALIIGAWAYFGSQPRSYLGSPAGVLEELQKWATGGRWAHIRVTLIEAGLGFLLGAVIALILALITTSSSFARRFTTPFVSALNAIPKIAVLPIFILLFGIEMDSKVYFAAAVIFFIPFFALYGAILNVDRTLLRNVRVLGAGRVWALRDVYIPTMVNAFVTSLRLTATWALLATVLAELVVSREGIGWVVRQGQENLNNDVIIGGLLLVAAVALCIDRLLVLVQNHILRWKR